RLGFNIRGGEAVPAAQFDRHVFIDRTGMRLLFRDAQLGEQVENLVSFHFQLSRQLIDPNLLHRKAICFYLLGRHYQPRLRPCRASAPSLGATPSELSPSAELSVGKPASSMVPNCSAVASTSAVSAATDPGSNRSSGLSGS